MPSINKVISSEDIATVAKLADKIWNTHYPPIIGQEQVDYMLSNFQSEFAIHEQIADNFKYFIVKSSNQHAGYFAIAPDIDTNSLQISKLYVNLEYQRLGLGRFIILFIEEYCLTQGIHNLWLTVNRHNTDAVDFYEKNGFNKTDCLVLDIGNGFVMDDYKMTKIISKYICKPFLYPF